MLAQQTGSAHVLRYHDDHENCATTLLRMHGVRTAIARRILYALGDSNAYLPRIYGVLEDPPALVLR